ncbi:NitT/TauT family transport system ATP-binding protein [Sphingobium sp. B2D3A]|uniref:ABC transporter ATP-binding protein n=1 Tax=unclassified Sphingobium TaxID=2611147 RepID=UPI002224C012|nr:MULTISPECIES: ABC transporter ATP-binding protein [unclassified Sphingobium]MCW2337064.1 NitT/TauT family transport system ATP-binding protein [Sphingobium sp. B2D3A]MCW2386817.1 NitT/TauT family transport system ATP-binding protein [Sphingobium sp. B2D3D]MCW2395478.1 NitT/TauT family transport system ATP-binding protein [Sphingobium sp. B8D3B]MCW2418993.1 NitT/TauT family transport system ATP-binding protein [Sphingobium sp. B8D3C]
MGDRRVDPNQGAADAAAPIVSFQDVSLTFGTGVEALRGINLDIRPGEFISILGPSGCGKSTLLRIAAGLIDYTDGALHADRSHIAFTFQDATLLPWRTVRRNVELLLELRGVGREERRRVAQEKIALVGLSGFEEQYPKHLSGGMKMRVSLARALTLDPTLFMFDEPFGALDEITRERLNDEVQTLQLRQQFAAMFVTHSVSEAVFMSSRVIVMSARPGRIVGTYDIPFPFPRDDAVRFSPQFAELCGTLSAALRDASGGVE